MPLEATDLLSVAVTLDAALGPRHKRRPYIGDEALEEYEWTNFGTR